MVTRDVLGGKIVHVRRTGIPKALLVLTEKDTRPELINYTDLGIIILV